MYRYWYVFFLALMFISSTLFGRSSTLPQQIDSLKLKLKELSSCPNSCQKDLIQVYDALNQANVLAFDSRTDSLAKQALAYAMEVDNEELSLSSYHAIAHHGIYTGNYELSIKAAQNGLKLSRATLSSQYPETKFLVAIGLAHTYLERYDEGVGYFLEVIDLVEDKYEADDLRIFPIFRALLNIGTIYIRQNQTQKALGYYEKGLKKLETLVEKYPDDVQVLSMQGSFLGSMGKAYFMMAEDYPKLDSISVDSLLTLAKSHYLLASDLLKQSGHLNNVAVSYHFLGDLYITMDSLDQAELYLLKSVRLRKELELFTTEYIVACKDLGKLYKNKNDYETSLFYLDEAIKMGEEVEAMQMLSEAYKQKADVLRLQGEYQKAYAILEKYTEANVKYQNQEQLNKINELNAKYESDRAEQVRAKEKAIAARIRVLWNAMFFSILMVAVFLTVYFYIQRDKLIVRNRRIGIERRRLKEEVQESKKELDAKSVELTHMAGMLIDRSTILDELKKEIIAFEKTHGISLEPILKSIKINQIVQSDIDRFQKILSEVNQDFFVNLSIAHSNLSAHERRLAALIKLGWASNQIASLEHTSSSTIRTRKSRLKRKLGVDNLERYLASF